MADNVAITAGTGTTIAADEVVDATLGTAKVQYVKLMDGTLNGVTKATVATAAQTMSAGYQLVAFATDSVNANGQATMANSAPVVLASNQSAIPFTDQYSTYKTVAASQTAFVLGATGAVGDYLAGLLIVPGTAAAGAVSITDGSGSAISVFAGGGTTALSDLKPFMVPIGAVTTSGAWKVTTGANVTAIGIGKFT
jgi:hypothetical protein